MVKKELTKSLIDSLKKKINLYDTVESGLILGMSKKGTKSFCFRYKFGRIKKRYTFGRYPSMSLAKARIKVQGFKNKLLNGIDPQAEQNKRKEAKTFAFLSNEFKLKHFKSIRESTKEKYR